MAHGLGVALAQVRLRPITVYLVHQDGAPTLAELGVPDGFREIAKMNTKYVCKYITLPFDIFGAPNDFSRKIAEMKKNMCAIYISIPRAN
jgi:hypothetical protein